MARFIDLDSLDGDKALWIMPEDLIRFDRREPPWPNSLFPYAQFIETTHPHFDQAVMIRMRRWCERELQGDVAVRFDSERSYNDLLIFYFDNAADSMQFHDRYGDQIVRTLDPIMDATP